MWTPECYIRRVPLPWAIPGIVLPNNDGTYDVYINSRLSAKGQEIAVDHEIEHIKDEHFASEKCIGQIEAEARRDIVCVPTEDEWLYDPYGVPLEPMPPHAPNEKVIPLYSDPNAIIRVWQKLGVYDLMMQSYTTKPRRD